MGRHGKDKPSVIPADRHIHHNLILATYNSQQAIDTDDGSAYIRVHDNVLISGDNGLKSDFGGHDEVYYNNILPYVGNCWKMWNFYGYNDGFWNNTCVFRDSYPSDCFPKGKGVGWEVHDNRVFSPSLPYKVCGMALEKWVDAGHDHGTTVAAWPKDEDLVAWSKALLGMAV